MTYVVFGSTGHTGKVVAERLLAAGKSVRLAARNRAKVSELEEKGGSFFEVNLEDAASVRAAIDGAQAGYFLIPTNFRAPDFRAYQGRVIEAIAIATRETGLKEAVLLSSVGAEQSSGTGPIVGLYHAEASFKERPTRWAFLRAAYFMENIGGSLSLLEQGLFPTFSPRDLVYEMVATQDIGQAAASLLLEGIQSTHAVNVTSGRYSASDVARVLGEILGKQIEVAEAPASSMAQTLKSYGMPSEMADLYQEMTEGMNAGRIRFEPGVHTIQGKTELSTVLRGLLGK